MQAAAEEGVDCRLAGSKLENLGILPYHRFTGKTIGKIILPVKTGKLQFF